MANVNTVIGSVLKLLNDSSVIPKPYSNHSGSLFFGPNQEIAFRRTMPKGQVTPDEDFNDTKSFGYPTKRDKHYNFFIDFYTQENRVDTEGNKDSELLSRYGDLIEDAFMNNRIGNFTWEDIRTEIAPRPAEELGNNIWVTRKLVVLKERK